jgi:signal transduction histidine kinase
VKLDPAQFEQVLMNLVINARDAMPDGGVLSIETANVELDEHYARQHQAVLPGAYVMLAVHDTGAGIPDAIRERLFEPFCTTRAGGTGLGLAVARRIIDAHSGGLTLESEAGRGTTASVWLPS